MNRLYQLLAAIIYVGLFFLLFPWYRYVIDSDGISYINVAERVAKGMYYHSVNGYWAPLSSWILVSFIKAGFDPLLSAKYLNGLLGLLTLYSCYSLMDKFKIHAILKSILPFVLAILLLSYCFYELCADLLQLLLLIIYLNLLFSNNFINSNTKIIFSGVVGALCYYAKAYSLPFFLLHFTVLLFVLLKQNKEVKIIQSVFKKMIWAFIPFFILVIPYVSVLTHKYGSVRFNNAGKINTSWMLSPGISDDRKIVAGLPYEDATSYWDEPTYAQEKWISPFTSVEYFIKEIKWTISNTVKFLGLLNEMSVCSFLFILAFIIYLWKRKEESVNELLLLLTAIIYPAGYMLIFIEWRYIWLLPILLLLMTAILLTKILEKEWLTTKKWMVVAVIICASFLVQPLSELQKLKNSYKDVFEIAEVFKKNNIKGNIFSNYKSSAPHSKTLTLCYLTQNKFYGPQLLDYSYEELMASAGQYNIDYYLYYYDYPSEKEMFLQSFYVKNVSKVFTDLYPGLIVVKLK